jgi:hypothetical protein
MAAKDIEGKPQLSLIPFQSLAKIADVRKFGVNKYGDDTCWKTVAQKDFLDATLRHVFKHLSGDTIDPESGLEHLAHAATSLILAMSVDEVQLEKEGYYNQEPDDLDSVYDQVIADYHPTHHPRRMYD